MDSQDFTKLLHVPTCFGCCQDNPVGLKLKFVFEGKSLVAEFTSNKYHMGPPDGVHGGVITAIVDEAFSMLVRKTLGHDIRTIKEEFSFKNMASVGEKVTVKATLLEEKSRVVIAQARVYTDEAVIAEATGTLFKVKKDSKNSRVFSR
ncbi:MAG: PaaI family thioesterase [Candidatus Omnitrophica bacterium]|nr:PaaI family thioesterase [Candidatus Omnitrophota bacterium]